MNINIITMINFISNCCGADILSPDNSGHGKCSDCKENCVPCDLHLEEREVYKNAEIYF